MDKQEGKRKRPLGITVLALMDISAPFVAIGQPIVPFYFFGIQIVSPFADIYAWVNYLLAFMIGYGLLKLRLWAWKVSIGFRLFGLLMLITNIALIKKTNHALFFEIFFFFYIVLTGFYIFKKKEFFTTG